MMGSGVVAVQRVRHYVVVRPLPNPVLCGCDENGCVLTHSREQFRALEARLTASQSRSGFGPVRVVWMSSLPFPIVVAAMWYVGDFFLPIFFTNPTSFLPPLLICTLITSSPRHHVRD